MAPHASRRRVVESDDDDDKPSEETKEEQPKPQKRSTGKLKSVKGKQSSAQPKVTSSPKPSPKKTRSKQATQEPAKPAAKPIYSFFNVATQKQQTSQPTPSPTKSEKISTPREDIEAIHDDTDDEQASHEPPPSTLVSKGSSTAAALRKRKFQRVHSFEDNAKVPLSTSQKFRKASGGDRVPSFSVINEDKRPWTEQFAPIDLTELAVHKRKVADVRSWLETTFRGRRQKVLILKGAAGSGKTTTLRLLAKELGAELVEWRDPNTSEYGENGFVSSGDRFEEFVARAGKCAGLTLSTDTNAKVPVETQLDTSEPDAPTRPQILLVEEFPNTFSKTSSTLQSFRSTISQYLSSPISSEATPTPLVMIISETLLSTNTAAADSFTAHRLLGPELITNPYVNTIEFNAVAVTFLTKALETIVIKEARKSGRRKTPGPQVLKHLAETGDIRSAVSSLEFLCLRGDEGDTWSSKVTFTKPKQSKSQPPLSKSEIEALKLITNRESSLGIFHAVGKVVYNKRTGPVNAADISQPPPWLPQHRRSKIPDTDADSLIDELGTDTSTFIAALHENYALSCSCSGSEESLNSLSGCMDNLSDSDLLSLDRFSFGTRAFSGSATDTLRQDEMCFQVAVRGLLFNLPCPVHRSAGTGGSRGDAHRMLYPNSLRLWRKREEIEGELRHLINKLSLGSEVGTSTSAASYVASTSGVDGWKRAQPSAIQDFAVDVLDAEQVSQAGGEIKKQMLLERLPYMAHIKTPTSTSMTSRRFLEQILSVTRISGETLGGGDGVGDDDDGEETANGGEQWATDRPENESSSKKGKQKTAFESVALPVETRIDKMILEDDDIVDD